MTVKESTINSTYIIHYSAAALIPMNYLVKKLISLEDRLPVAMMGAGDGLHQRSVQYSFHLLDINIY